MDRSRLAIIIPSFNEEATIVEVIAEVIEYGIPIVVDDGSTDQTVYLARDAGATVISHSVNLGYDAALESGFINANRVGCDFALTIDADGQQDPIFLPIFIDALLKGADVVIGIRKRRPRFSESLFAMVSKIMWGIRDPLCGMKAYRMDLYRALGHFDSYGSIGTELAIYAAKQQKNISQIPIIDRNRKDSPRFGGVLGPNLKITRALFKAF